MTTQWKTAQEKRVKLDSDETQQEHVHLSLLFFKWNAVHYLPQLEMYSQRQRHFGLSKSHQGRGQWETRSATGTGKTDTAAGLKRPWTSSE
jgi:hypothetical protein